MIMLGVFRGDWSPDPWALATIAFFAVVFVVCALLAAREMG